MLISYCGFLFSLLIENNIYLKTGSSLIKFYSCEGLSKQQGDTSVKNDSSNSHQPNQKQAPQASAAVQCALAR